MPTKNPAWLETAVFYEIYPQTFYDSNGDGIGDLPGIIQKLDYLVSLGVNALWLNPCFVSPFGDAGYDVADFYQVAPRYGTNEDLIRLFEAAHRRGLRVLLDLVAGHTSIEHPWFKESCKHARNRFSDWFIWTDSAWSQPIPELQIIRGYAERNGSYIVNFFHMQPALNYGFANPDPRYLWQQPVDAPGPRAIRQEMKNIMKFWLDQGADGFRVDMAASLVKIDPGHRMVSKFWQEVRQWLDQEYPQAVLVSEWSNPGEAIPAGFHMDFTLHFNMVGYTSLFRKSFGASQGSDRYGWSFFDASGHGNICQFLDEYLPHYEKTKGSGFICIPSGNHDIRPRLATGRSLPELKVAFLFLLTMPGVPFIYYGDEIGMRFVEGLPSKEGGYERTGSRTPMQWDDTANAGFSTAPAKALYLPVDGQPGRPQVADQESDPASLLNTVRKLVELRKAHRALCASGAFEPVFAQAGHSLFIYRRTGAGEDLLVAVNPAAQQVEARLPAGLVRGQPESLYGAAGAFSQDGDGWLIRLPGISGGVYQLD
jgi:maltose alpha-D-glucosyltransferase/alpha-amylase